jgi:hypothetical protein
MRRSMAVPWSRLGSPVPNALANALWKGPMAERRVKIWFYPEGDYLEVVFDQKQGYFRETPSDQVMEKVDEQGNILGFSVLRVSALKQKPLEVAL